MLTPPSSPRRDALASRWHAALHGVVVIAGWGLFAWSWWLVLGQPRATEGLRNLIVGAALAMPALTVAWILHNVGIHRRKGPRRAARPVPMTYDVDFNGRRIEADWPALQQARKVAIECADGVKRYVPDPGAPAPGPVAPAVVPQHAPPAVAPLPAPRRREFADTET